MIKFVKKLTTKIDINRKYVNKISLKQNIKKGKRIMESLSSSELKVMNLIWNSDVELNSKDITTTFEKNYGTTKATTMTFLKRLEKKGYITSKKIGRVTENKV